MISFLIWGDIMSKKTSYKLLEKSLDAALLAVELYNKPNIDYREESFSVLMINAYELLFKAKIVDDTKSLRSIYVYEKKKLADDSSSKREYIKRNRIGEPMTRGIMNVMTLLKNQKKITQNIYENISLLIEIRDNSVHFLNNNSLLKYKLYTICVAAVKNYYRLIEKWFNNFNLSNYNFFITPINFSEIDENVESLNLEVAQKNFVNYINLASSAADGNDDFDVCIKTELKFTKVETDEALLIQYAKEGKRINVEINDELFKKMYPLDFSTMIANLKKKYNLKINDKFNKAKNLLQEEEICCKARYLDPNRKGTSRYYYNSNFIYKVYEQIKKEEDQTN